MKKLLYCLIATASFVLASCTGDYTDWAKPQAYSQEEAAAKYGITFTTGPDANIVMPVEDDEVKIVQINAQNDNISGYTVKSLTINGEKIEANTDGNYITVSAKALNALIEKINNSRASVMRSYTVKTIVSINLKSGEAVTFETEAEIAGSLKPKATPAIDNKGYFILGDFEENTNANGNGWQADKPIWMTDNGDGTFSTVVTTLNEGDNWFKFYEGGNYVPGDWDSINKGEMGCAVNGDKSLNGFIVFKGDYQSVQTPVVEGEPGNMYKITIDMNNLTYNVARVPVNLYLIGGTNDWKTSAVERLVKFNQADPEKAVYTLTIPAAKGDTWFAFGDDKACDAIANNNDWSLLYATVNGNGKNGESGKMVRRTKMPAGDDGSFMVAAGPDLIQITVDLSKATYEIKGIELSPLYYVVGGIQGWSDKNKTHIFTPQSKKVLSYTTKWTGAWDLKFWNANDFGNWDKAYGCVVDGDSSPSGTIIGSGAQAISAPSAEYYTFTIDMENMVYTWTKLENQAPTEYEFISLIGEFNGWNGDYELTQVAPHNWHCVFTQENAGMLKYRANHAWSTNWGYGSDGDWNVATAIDHIGTNGGGNIYVPAGTYDVYLNDITSSMLFVQQ